MAVSSSGEGRSRMTSFRPTPEQERWMQVASRTKLKRDTSWLTERISGWTAVTSLTRCAFFIFGIFAAGLIATVFHLLRVPGFLLISGLFLVGVAEWLVVKRRLLGAGVEEAFELAGLLLIAFEFVDVQRDPSSVRISLLITTMLLVAGLRLLNPLFITLSVMAFSSTIDFTWVRYDGGAIPHAPVASAFCLAVAGAALYINKVKFRRPSYDQTFNWLVLTMPLAGYLWFETQNAAELSVETFGAEVFVRFLPVLALMTFGLTALIVGIRRRTHAPIIAFMICVGCVAYELRHLTTLSLQAKLIGWGTLALLLTIGLDRYLRTPRRGITSNQFPEIKGSLDLLQLAGASALAPPSVQPSDAPFKGGGGTFGGGGASGSY
jgi:hypothetical protein